MLENLSKRYRSTHLQVFSITTCDGGWVSGDCITRNAKLSISLDADLLTGQKMRTVMVVSSLLRK